MNLTQKDYLGLIYARANVITNQCSSQWGNAPVAVGYANEPPPERVPDFEGMRQAHGEIGELIDALENSIGPA